MNIDVKIKHPAIRYHGGKFRLAPWIIEQMPEHVCYVEPFGGAAGVLLQKPRSYSEVYNDLDGEVVNLFRVLRNPELNQRLQDACRLTPYSRDEFCHAQQPATDSVERARRMVVRACMGFGSAAGIGGNSGFRGDSKRKYATAAHLWERYPENLAALCQRLQGVIIENKDALSVMRAHDAQTTLHYIDPPYVPETRVQGNRYYAYEMTVEGHEQLLAVARTMTGMVMISGYDTEVYNDMLSGWAKTEKTSRISAGRGTKVRTECLWLNPAAQQKQERAA
ncbi:TPA: DNA adenine methylase [Klebsiella pneumoniae]|uniref:DNA adenine methylase n=1 Tax=Klebsiella pneumoniae complex TaxID=3390273 RepID=UPI000E2C871D|nr:MULTISPECIES: DNA adenine methylase [Klebsiella]HDS6373357.1 DNA adenine methylase [Klebsiella quasipneumoniae subsp. similipneumoniae]EIV7914880.1 DNA adenine methylase [Klebsiella pneumoniae]EJO2885463.1 DNA adenine methylase [Klebsiella pneumoniae]EKQ7272722.1 DNA adenine methylase [Klebsiella pneumoniae]EKZ6414887.1 DNA adenine methylase [Klebsiella pneumoniae]